MRAMYLAAGWLLVLAGPAGAGRPLDVDDADPVAAGLLETVWGASSY